MDVRNAILHPFKVQNKSNNGEGAESIGPPDRTATMRWRFAALPLLLLLTLLLAVAQLSNAQSDPSLGEYDDDLDDADDLERLQALLDEAEEMGIELDAEDAIDELAGLSDDVPVEDVEDAPPKATKPVVKTPEPAPKAKPEPAKANPTPAVKTAKKADPSSPAEPKGATAPKTPPTEDTKAAAERTAKRLEELEQKRAEDVKRMEEESAKRRAQTLKQRADDAARKKAEAEAARVGEPEPTDSSDDVAPAPAPRARMLLDDAEELGTYASDAAARAALERDLTRRSLLTLSVSGDNTRWVGFEDMPQRLKEQRSGPEVRIARDHGNTQVTRPGGYWQAARFNKVERPSRNRLPANFGRGSGEGTLAGPRAGINQHDRVGINKASGWPGRLHDSQRGTDSYPAMDTRDNVGTHIQPFVKGVTSYSPNRRFQNYQYRNQFQASYFTCGTQTNTVATSYTGGASLCASGGRYMNVVGTHSLRDGDYITFSGVLGDDRADLNNKVLKVLGVGADMNNFSVVPSADFFPTGQKKWDVSSAYITKLKTTTAANPHPLVSESDWSYEEGDKIYFFVTFNEAVQVTGAPKLLLNTGNHFEAGAVNGYATFIGGGFGEKKTFWKNNERSPIKNPMEPNSWYEDLYHVNDGGCTMRGFQGVADTVTGATVPDCATYSGVTKTADAKVRTRRVHPFEKGDLVIIQGVTGADAHLLNKQHTIGSVSSTGASGNDLFTFIPPLDLSDGSLEFDARFAIVGRANIGASCRAGGVGDKTSHGENYCMFSHDTRYSLPVSDSTLLDHTRYAQQLPGQPGRFGIGNTGGGATFAVAAEEGGSVVNTRKEIQYAEDRTEQYMDNVLAFEIVVQSDDAYDQADVANTADQEHLSADLDYASKNALELNGGTIKRACANVFQVKSIDCAGNATVEVYGKHRLLPGDIVQLEGIDADADLVSDASVASTIRHEMNREHVVHALPTDAGTSLDRLDWNSIWDASPPWGSDVSKFQIKLDTADTAAATKLCGDGGATAQFKVTRTKSIARRKRGYMGDGTLCKFVDADLKLPTPGDKMKGSRGYVQSLSFNKDITVGRAYVTNVTTDAAPGIYGYNDGFGVRAGSAINFGTPDIVDIKVSFSEPVLASCGADDDKWSAPEQYPGLRMRVCTSIKLVLSTKDAASCPGSDCTNDANEDSTKGEFGTEKFPTSFLYQTDYDPPNVLNFRYVPRRGDDAQTLQYVDQTSLSVGCAELDSSSTCVSMSHVRRIADNKPAGLKLPPTSRETGKCPPAFSVAGEQLCPGATSGAPTADHRYSLAGSKKITVNAVF